MAQEPYLQTNNLVKFMEKTNCGCGGAQGGARPSLRVVQGNDFILPVNLYEPRADQNEGRKPLNAESLGEIVAKIIDRAGVETTANFAIVGEDKNVLALEISAETPLGVYDICVSGTATNGKKFRSYERSVFVIVQSNAESLTSPQVIEGEPSYLYDMTFQLLTQALPESEGGNPLNKEDVRKEIIKFLDLEREWGRLGAAKRFVDL